MATAILGGLRRQGVPASQFLVVEPLASQRDKLATEWGVMALPEADASLMPALHEAALAAMTALEQAVQGLRDSRAREGDKLVTMEERRLPLPARIYNR